ncbi:mCG145472 [Mus musculus]|nr:mCG145472 [Mus musculus]
MPSSLRCQGRSTLPSLFLRNGNQQGIPEQGHSLTCMGKTRTNTHGNIKSRGEKKIQSQCVILNHSPSDTKLHRSFMSHLGKVVERKTLDGIMCAHYQHLEW